MILVTGSTGFLGQHLVRRLLEAGQTEIRLLCRTKPTTSLFAPHAPEIAIGDLTDPPSLERAVEGVRRIYHVAGRVDFNPRDSKLLLAVNEQGTRNLLDAALRARVERIVHVSSVSTIGAAADREHPLTEDDFGRGAGIDLPYPRSKLLGETVALEFAQRGLPVVIVNPTFFLGPGDRNLSSARTVVSYLHRQTWVGLTAGGFGLTDVRDVAAGIEAAMERGRPGRRYILGGHNLLLREYHALLEEATGLPAPRLRLPPNLALALAAIGALAYGLIGRKRYVGVGDVRMGRHYWMYDYSRCRDELGLVCRPARETIRDTLAWLASEGYHHPRVGVVRHDQ